MEARKLLASAPGLCVNLRKICREIRRSGHTAQPESFRAFGVPSLAEQSDGIGLCHASTSALLPEMLRLSCPEGPLLGDPP